MSQVTRLQTAMDGQEIVAQQLNRKELRKEKLMEYLAAKGRLKPPNPKPYLRDDIKVKKTTMSTVKDDLAKGKENQGPNALKMKEEAVKVQPLTAKAIAQTSGTPCCTTKKQSSTNCNTLRLLSALSITARLNALKGLKKPSAVAPSHSASLKTAPAKLQCTVPTNQPRTQANPPVCNTLDSSAKPLANTGRTRSVSITRPKPNTTGKLASTLCTASTRPITASTRPITASTRPITASTRPITASTRPITASTRPITASTRPITASTRPITASTRPVTASTRPVTASTRPVTASTRPVTASTRPVTASTRPVTASTRPNSASTRPNSASTRPNTSGSARMSPSTMVKTKTGLVSVQVQPRSTTVPSAPAPFTTSVLNRASPSTTPVPAVTQKPPVTAQRRTNPFTSVSETNHRTNALAVDNGQRRSQAVSRTDSKPLPGRSSKKAGQRQPVTGLKPTVQGPAGPGPKTAVMKPGDQRTTRTSARVSIQEVERIQKAPSQHRAEVSRAGASTRIWKAASRASTGITGNQWQAKALSRAMHAAVAEMGQKSSGEENRTRVECGRADTVTQNEPNAPSPSSASPVCWPRPNRNTVNGVWIPQTVPRSARGSSHGQEEEEVGWEAGVGLKTPRDQARLVPKTEGRRKMTAAQEERMQKLQEWRENRGISYKRPPMPVRPPRVRRTVALHQAYWDSMEEEVEARSLVGAVDRCLADCIKLLDEGYPSSQVQEMLSTVPMAKKFSKYWICQARLMERQGNLEVLPLFEEAVGVVLEPVDELRTVVFEMLKKKEETQGQSPVASEPVSEEDDVVELDSTADPMATPTAVKALIRGDRGGSSMVKYKITATPGGFRSQQREAAVARVVDGQELRFFTPVRRSVRIERSALCYPASLQEHDLCVASFNDLMAQQDEREGQGDREEGGSAGPVPNGHLYVYRENGALRDQVNIQLVYAEDEN